MAANTNNPAGSATGIDAVLSPADRSEFGPAAGAHEITPVRAWWIYLKHRGVLNVDEFRRAKTTIP